MTYSAISDLVYLPEVAALEWACHHLQFAADHAAFTISLLEKLSPDDYDTLHFQLHPASQLIQFQYPILRIIELCDNKMNEGGINLLIIRREFDIELVSISTSEFIFLTAKKISQLHDGMQIEIFLYM